MTQLNELRLFQALRQRGLDTCGLPPERLDALAPLLGELGVDGAAIGRIVDAFYQAVAFQVVDQAGHRPRGNVQHLRQLAHGETPSRLVFQAHQDLEAALAEPEALRPALHGHVELLPQDADGGQRLRSRVDVSALSRQDLANSRVEEVTVRVSLEIGMLVIGFESELTHIYRTHYYPTQETVKPGIGGGPVTGWRAPARQLCLCD